MKTVIKDTIRPLLPDPVLSFRKQLLDAWPLFGLLRHSPGAFRLIRKMNAAHQGLRCIHKPGEIAEVAAGILARHHLPGAIVEARAFKGGSTAKLSLLARHERRSLYVFDSFAGLPPTQEVHTKNIWGYDARFEKGDWAGSLEEVKQNVRRFGELEVCEFIPGYFEDTMPEFEKPVVVAFIDVDLAASTETCLKYLWPLVVPGGAIFSHDGHLPLCVEVFRQFSQRMGVNIAGLEERKLLEIRKEAVTT